MKPSEEYIAHVCSLDLCDAQYLEKAMVKAELYEHAAVCRQRIEEQTDQTLRDVGI